MVYLVSVVYYYFQVLQVYLSARSMLPYGIPLVSMDNLIAGMIARQSAVDSSLQINGARQADDKTQNMWPGETR